MRKKEIKLLQESLIIERLFSLSLLFEKLGFKKDGFNLNYSGNKCALFLLEDNFDKALDKLLKGLENYSDSLWLKGVFHKTTQIINGGIYKKNYFEPFGSKNEDKLENLLYTIQELENFINELANLIKKTSN